MASSCGFPAGITGAGLTIAIIELGGGFSPSDLSTYFGGLGSPDGAALLKRLQS